MLRLLPPQMSEFGAGASFGFGKQNALFRDSLVEVFVRDFCSFLMIIEFRSDLKLKLHSIQ